MNRIDEDYIFLSYSHKDDIKSYITFLDNLGYNVLFDEEMSVGSDWELRARRYISSPRCKGVVVFLSENSTVSKPILREMEFCQRYNKSIFPLILNYNSVSALYDKVISRQKNEDDIFLVDELFSFFPSDKIYVTSDQFTSSEHLQKMNNTFKEWGMVPRANKDRIHSTYTSERKDEVGRLKQQQRLFLDFDKKVLKDILDKFPDKCYLMDIGCNDGNLIMNRIPPESNVSVIGVDINMQAINRGNANYPEEKFKGYCIDCLCEDFIESMTEIMESQGIEDGFDVVVCSMILLHVDDAYKCLKNIRKLLKPGGYIYIRDMDDGLALSHPDPNKLVETFNQYSKELSFTGYRLCGRELYQMLVKNHFRSIEIIPHEITTVGKDPDFLDVLYNVNFKFILAGLAQRYEANPNNLEYKNSYEWGKKSFDDLEDLFHTPGYYYRMGTIVFVARR